jgi:hypothetical protein
MYQYFEGVEIGSIELCPPLANSGLDFSVLLVEERG